MLRAAFVVFTGFVLALTVTLAQAPAATPPLPTVMISRHLADDAGLAVGSVARFAAEVSGADAREFRVAAIYEPEPDPIELNASRYEARLHLPDMLGLAAHSDPAAGEGISGISITLADPASTDTFTRDVMARFPGIYADRSDAATGVGTFVVLERFHQAIAIVTILASTIFLLALTVMLVDERRETVGILRLIGLTSRRVLFQVFLEGLVVAAAGAVFGLGLALLSESLINTYFQWHYDTNIVFVRVTPAVWLQCLAIAVPLGAGASVAASWTLLRRQVLSLARR